MITRLNPNDRKKYPELLDFIKHTSDSDFYLTEENSRIYINDFVSLRKMFKSSNQIYVIREDGEYGGIVLTWRSFGGNIKRYYVKLLAIDAHTANSLMRGFLWNVYSELYLKVDKSHRFLDVFKRNGFKFVGGRGKQILLYRQKPIRRKREVREEEDGHNTE